MEMSIFANLNVLWKMSIFGRIDKKKIIHEKYT